MKIINILKYSTLIIISIIWLFYLSELTLWYEIPGRQEIKNDSIDLDIVYYDPVNNINNVWYKVLSIVKLALEWLLVIFIVYIWAQMIWSMWADEEALSKSKRQLMYSVFALLFINMPWNLYNSFHKRDHGDLWNSIDNPTFVGWEENIFFDWFNFGHTFWDKVVWFLEVMIFAIAVIMIIYEGLKLITSRWREEKITEAKTKVTYSILAMVFVWVIETFKSFSFDFKASKVVNIFGELSDLALFFAWPVAFFFLTMAWFYYVTSAWDEEKIKKAKSIVINTILATLILLAAYTFLLDLAEL